MIALYFTLAFTLLFSLQCLAEAFAIILRREKQSYAENFQRTHFVFSLPRGITLLSDLP